MWQPLYLLLFLPSTLIRAVPLFSRDAGSFVAAGWYTGWHSQNFALTDISWSKYTTLYYAFAFVVSLFRLRYKLIPRVVRPLPM